MDPVTHSETTTHPTTPSVWSKGSKGGLITGAVLIVFSLVIHLIGETSNQLLSGIFTIISLIVGIVLTHRAFKEENGGFMTYGQGLGMGSVVGLISGVLLGIFSFIYISFVDDSSIQQAIDTARDQYEEMGMSDAQIDQSMGMVEMFTSPAMIFVFSVLGVLLYAFILSLIISAFTKNNHPEHVY